EWAGVETYRAWVAGTLSLSDILRQHNEHRIPLTQLTLLIDFALFQGRSTFAHWVLLLSHIGLGAVLGLVATQGQGAGARVLAVAVGIAFLVAPVKIDNLVSPFHLNWAASGLLAFGALFWTARLVEPVQPGAHAAAVALAAALTVLAVYSSANG